MWNAQSGCCAICGHPIEGWPHIDHDHKTGRIRGLLDGYCNYRFLGPLERGGRARLERAVPYLRWGRLTPKVQESAPVMVTKQPRRRHRHS